MPSITITSIKITGRTIDLDLFVYDDDGKPLHKEPIKDSLETDGTHTEEQVLAFVKRKPIVFLQQMARKEAIVENILRRLPEKMEITPEDLAKKDPMTIPAAASGGIKNK